ncbi:Uncharacterized protein BP5553_01836 [Venustampulla echinocandica]|uniref:Uncharacterized protein n=1 Tax=Venustampulla echinocandica TaxID=2656787 RepID=A0A370U256_9HELO|nr:Uncharacterized protein BP5553_01836 [Venustampulla echinocandica]RDL41857.1 Uncharacterized protein BP5553_01836 [Venustampulla echinocandica]
MSPTTSTHPGRQSPSPDSSSGAQQKSPPGSGKGVDSDTHNQDDCKSQIKGLESNPKGPLEDHLKEASSKTMKPTQATK